MISIKDMSYNELMEKIENCKELIEEYEVGTGDYNTCKAELHVVEKELNIRREQIRRQIIKDITAPDTMSKEEAGYLSYQTFLSDAEMGNVLYTDILFEDFEEKELEKLWKESH